MIPLVVLMVRVAMFPDMAPIEAGRFKNVVDCTTYATSLDNSTPVILKLSCELLA